MQRLDSTPNESRDPFVFFQRYEIFDDIEHFDTMISLQYFQFFEIVRSAVMLAIHQSTKLVLKVFQFFN